MSKDPNSWFHMRSGFSTFRLEPEKHPQFLFGMRERQKRDLLLGAIEGAGYSGDGHKAVVYGDYGRGKTHLCHNLASEIRRTALNVIPVYIKCSAYAAKEPFYSLFKEMVTRLPTEDLHRVATEYARLADRGEATPLIDIVQSEDIALVMARGLSAVDQDVVRNSKRWLGGEPKVSMGLISQALKPQLNDSREFGAVMRGIAHMFATVDKKSPLYLVDEAERFQDVTNVDTFAQWLAALRELTEIVEVGFIFFIGANSRNNLPVLVVQPEIVRRIGVANYVEFQNPARDELREFLHELLSTFIRKGDVPEPHRSLLSAETADPTVPAELTALTGGDARFLESYPFEPAALDEFIEQVGLGDLASKPSEVLIRLQKAAHHAMRSGTHVIDSAIVNSLDSEGY